MDCGKKLRSAITPSSEHFAFWGEAIKVLNSITFLKPGNKESIPPTVGNFVFTVNAVKCLYKNVHDLGYEYLCPKNLNQDPLENFFGCIRLQRGRNVNPTCSSFVTSFKSLLINNFVSPHSPYANSEEDESDGAITTLASFLQTEEDDQELPEDVDDENEEPPPEKHAAYLEDQTQAYVAGYIAKKLLKQIKCDICRKELITTDQLPEHDLIVIKTYPYSELTKPNTSFIKLFSRCSTIAQHFIPKQQEDAFKKLGLKIRKFLQVSDISFTCIQHDILKLFIDLFLNLYVNTWTKNVTKILHGLDDRVINDEVKKAALLEAKKHGRFEKAISRKKQLK